MARRLSFINYKGGVGKTSCVVNTSAAIAQKGRRVLLFDFDAQSNASIWLMRLERWNVINTKNDGSIFSIFDPGRQTIRDCIQKDVVQDRNGNALLPGLDLVPTTFNLVDLEHEFEGDPKRPPYLIFQEQLAELEGDYDYIILGIIYLTHLKSVISWWHEKERRSKFTWDLRQIPYRKGLH